MANIKSAQKRMKHSASRAARNRAVTSRLRTSIKKTREGEDTSGAEAVVEVYSEIDRAWKKGVIHKNAAARYKSRLAKRARKA